MKTALVTIAILTVLLVANFLTKKSSLDSKGNPEGTSKISKQPESKEQVIQVEHQIETPQSPTSPVDSSATLHQQNEIILKPLDEEAIKNLVSMAWISSPGSLEPKSTNFDEKLFELSTTSNSWRPFKTLRNGVYAGVFETLGSPSSTYPFWIFIQNGGPNGLQMVWLRWSEADLVGPSYDLAFIKPFTSEEVFKRSFHLPVAPFVGKLSEASDCKEIMLIPYIETAPDQEFLHSIASRAYCRKGATQLVPLGQFAVTFDHSI
jgi:hypothetical protein